MPLDLFWEMHLKKEQGGFQGRPNSATKFLTKVVSDEEFSEERFEYTSLRCWLPLRSVTHHL